MGGASSFIEDTISDIWGDVGGASLWEDMWNQAESYNDYGSGELGESKTEDNVENGVDTVDDISVDSDKNKEKEKVYENVGGVGSDMNETTAKQASVIQSGNGILSQGEYMFDDDDIGFRFTKKLGE